MSPRPGEQEEEGRTVTYTFYNLSCPDYFSADFPEPEDVYPHLLNQNLADDSLRLPQDITRTGNGTWAYRGTGAPRRGGHLPELKAGFGTLPRNRSEDGEGSSPESGTSSGPTDELSTAFMSLAYAKLLKLRKQKEELTRIYNMLEDLENDFLGSKDSDTTYIERFMEVKVKKDYMLSPGNPETTLEQEDKVKVYGYLGHNSWRIMGPYCKGYCKKNTVVVNPRIKSQNQISDLTIVCNSCNKITVPLIGAVPTSILAIRNVNLNQPG